MILAHERWNILNRSDWKDIGLLIILQYQWDIELAKLRKSWTFCCYSKGTWRHMRLGIPISSSAQYFTLTNHSVMKNCYLYNMYVMQNNVGRDRKFNEMTLILAVPGRRKRFPRHIPKRMRSATLGAHGISIERVLINRETVVVCNWLGIWNELFLALSNPKCAKTSWNRVIAEISFNSDSENAKILISLMFDLYLIWN